MPVRRRLLPVLLAAVVLPAAALGALLVTVPGASAGIGPLAAASEPPTTAPSTPSTTPYPPGPPGDLTATAVRTSSVTLTWTASRVGCCSIEAYQITYLRAFDDVVQLARVGNVTTATITGLSRTTQYSFRVAAIDFQGRYSASSNTVTVVTPATDTGPDTTPPAAPTGLTATDATGYSAVLTWSPASDDTGVTGYQVYRFDGWYTSTLLATVPDTRHLVQLVTVGRNLFYVRARDAAGNVSIAAGPITIEGTGPPPTTAPPGTCRVTYTTQSQWSGGFVAAVTVHNTGSTPVDGWTLGFGFPGDQRIVSLWGGAHTQTGAAVTVRDAGWNSMIAPGGRASFGMQGTWAASNAPPTAFTLNGAPCTV